jgi:hypothetical protein
VKLFDKLGMLGSYPAETPAITLASKQTNTGVAEAFTLVGAAVALPIVAGIIESIVRGTKKRAKSAPGK